MGRRGRLFVDGSIHHHYLAWLTAWMTFIAGLAVAGLLLVDDAAASWQRRLTGVVTVQIPAGQTPATDDQTVDTALAALRSASGVATAKEVPPPEVLRLLSPWLAGEGMATDLPLPRLIEVTLDPDFRFDAERLGQQLQAVAPGTVVDDHGRRLGGAIHLLHRLQFVGCAVLAAIGFAIAASAVMTTRGGLAAHRESVEVLYLLGADDAFIAHRFARQAFVRGLIGGVLGLALAGVGVEAVAALATEFRQGLFAELRLGPRQWLALAALPPAIGLITMLAARITVMRSLRRML